MNKKPPTITNEMCKCGHLRTDHNHLIKDGQILEANSASCRICLACSHFHWTHFIYKK